MTTRKQNHREVKYLVLRAVLQLAERGERNFYLGAQFFTCSWECWKRRVFAALKRTANEVTEGGEHPCSAQRQLPWSGTSCYLCDRISWFCVRCNKEVTLESVNILK